MPSSKDKKDSSKPQSDRFAKYKAHDTTQASASKYTPTRGQKEDSGDSNSRLNYSRFQNSSKNDQSSYMDRSYQKAEVKKDEERKTFKKEKKVNDTPNFTERITYDKKKEYPDKIDNPPPVERREAKKARKMETESFNSEITSERTSDLKSRIKNKIGESYKKFSNMKNSTPIQELRKASKTPDVTSNNLKYSLNLAKENKKASKSTRKIKNDESLVHSLINVPGEDELSVSDDETHYYDPEEFGEEDYREFGKIGDRIFDSYDRAGKNVITDRAARTMLEDCYYNFKPSKRIEEEDG